MNIQEVRDNGWLIFEGLVGSHAYGTNVEGSDKDYKGIFVLPTNKILSGNVIEQVSGKDPDTTFYEVGRFLELLRKSNPNILEMLNLPKECIVHTTSTYSKYIQPLLDIAVTKKLRHTLCGYAYAQIQKATGLKKKMNNPMAKEKQTPLDFCYFVDKNTGKTRPLIKQLKEEKWLQQYCGLAATSNGGQLYKLYYDYVRHLRHEDKVDNPRLESDYEYYGIIKSDKSNDVTLSSIPKGALLEGFVWFNHNGYAIYCKEYAQYWEWVEKRNELRYQMNQEAGQNVDLKNALHTMRLLHMAEDIAEGKGIVVRRPEKDYLIDIRKGLYSYDDLVLKSDEKMKGMKEKFEKSDLPEEIPHKKLEQILLTIRLENL